MREKLKELEPLILEISQILLGDQAGGSDDEIMVASAVYVALQYQSGAIRYEQYLEDVDSILQGNYCLAEIDGESE